MLYYIYVIFFLNLYIIDLEKETVQVGLFLLDRMIYGLYIYTPKLGRSILRLTIPSGFAGISTSAVPVRTLYA